MLNKMICIGLYVLLCSVATATDLISKPVVMKKMQKKELLVQKIEFSRCSPYPLCAIYPDVNSKNFESKNNL